MKPAKKPGRPPTTGATRTRATMERFTDQEYAAIERACPSGMPLAIYTRTIILQSERVARELRRGGAK